MGYRRKVDGNPAHFGAGHTGQLQHIIDEQSHALGFRANAHQVLTPSVIKLVAAILQQGVAPTVNSAQGSAQVMGNGVGKGFELLVGDFQLGSAAMDALFQLGVEQADFFLGFSSPGDIHGHADHQSASIRQSAQGRRAKLPDACFAVFGANRVVPPVFSAVHFIEGINVGLDPRLGLPIGALGPITRGCQFLRTIASDLTP